MIVIKSLNIGNFIDTTTLETKFTIVECLQDKAELSCEFGESWDLLRPTVWKLRRNRFGKKYRKRKGMVVTRNGACHSK